MKNITFAVYTIEELKNINIAAYKKVLEDTKQYLIDDNFNYAAEDVIYTLKEKYNLSIEEKSIFYSISFCQGDGFCFIKNNLLSYTRLKEKSEDCNIFEKWIINNLSDSECKLLLEYLNCNYNLNIIKTSHHYQHAHTCKIDYEPFYSSNDDAFNEKMDQFIYELTQKLFDSVYVEICASIEQMLYKYYDIEEDAIIEFSNMNEYFYDKNGVLYN